MVGTALHRNRTSSVRMFQPHHSSLISDSLKAPTRFPLDLTIIIVTYNGWSFCEQCLNALPLACQGLQYEVIVVDNGSHDGTPDNIVRFFPAVSVLRLGRNLGFAAANNRGMILARGRYILLLNSDTNPAPDSLKILVHFLEHHPTVGIVAPRLTNPDGSDQGTARRFSGPLDALFGRTSFITRCIPNHPWARRNLQSRWHTDDAPFAVDQVSGACLLARRSAMAQVGLLDENFFFYWEDGDWCRRFKELSWQVWCEPSARVIHYEHKSSDHQSVRLVIEFHRSVYRYYCKHHARGARAPLRIIAASGLIARASLILLSRSIRHSFRQPEIT